MAYVSVKRHAFSQTNLKHSSAMNFERSFRGCLQNIACHMLLTYVTNIWPIRKTLNFTLTDRKLSNSSSFMEL